LRCLNNVSSRKLVAVWQTMITEHNDNSRSCCCRSSSIILLPFPGSAGDFCITLLRFFTASHLTTILCNHATSKNSTVYFPNRPKKYFVCGYTFAKMLEIADFFRFTSSGTEQFSRHPTKNQENLFYFRVGLPSSSLAVGVRLNLMEAYFRES